MRYFKYGNGGGIQRVMSREINECSGYYDTLHDLLCSIEWCDVSACKIIEYGYDNRLDRYVYMVVQDRGEYKEQFVSYFIED